MRLTKAYSTGASAAIMPSVDVAARIASESLSSSGPVVRDPSRRLGMTATGRHSHSIVPGGLLVMS